MKVMVRRIIRIMIFFPCIAYAAESKFPTQVKLNNGVQNVSFEDVQALKESQVINQQLTENPTLNIIIIPIDRQLFKSQFLPLLKKVHEANSSKGLKKEFALCDLKKMLFHLPKSQLNTIIQKATELQVPLLIEQATLVLQQG